MTSPSAVRATTDGAELKREVMLSLLEAEDFGGAKPLAEIVVVKQESPEAPESQESPEDQAYPETPERPEPGDAAASAR